MLRRTEADEEQYLLEAGNQQPKRERGTIPLRARLKDLATSQLRARARDRERESRDEDWRDMDKRGSLRCDRDLEADGNEKRDLRGTGLLGGYLLQVALFIYEGLRGAD